MAGFGGDYPKQYYFIKSCYGHVLDIEGGSRSPGARVITWPKKHSDFDNQLWYDHPATGTIRSKVNDFCLDIEGNDLVVNPFQYGEPNQQWMRAGEFIRNRIDRDKVLDISGENCDQGARLCSWDCHGGQNQTFDFEFVHGWQRHLFFIVSEMHGKVLDIEGADSGPGANVIVWPRKSSNDKNQLWYIDQNGIIRSSLNGHALQSSGHGNQITMQPFNGGFDQEWHLCGPMICNPNGECLDIRGASHSDGAEIIAYDYQQHKNQQWRLEFI